MAEKIRNIRIVRASDSCEEKRTYECCLCGKRFSGYGNNPYPIKKEGRCCDECNSSLVIPVRIVGLMRTHSEDPETRLISSMLYSQFDDSEDWEDEDDEYA